MTIIRVSDYFQVAMPVVIKDVLVLDAVGSKCVEILIAHGFNVTKMSAPSEIRLMEVIDVSSHIHAD